MPNRKIFLAILAFVTSLAVYIETCQISKVIRENYILLGGLFLNVTVCYAAG